MSWSKYNHKAFKENTRTNLVRARFLTSSNDHLGQLLIFTRRRPVSSQGHGLIDFYFHSIFPLEFAFFSASWNKTSKSRRRKSRKTPHSAGKHKKSAERSAKGAPLWGYRKVKIINVDSIEALHAHKGGKTLHFGSADPHGVINSFKGAGIKSEQRESGQGERRLSVRQTGLAPARAFSPASLLSQNTKIFPNCSACLTITSMLFGVCCNAVLKLSVKRTGHWQWF